MSRWPPALRALVLFALIWGFLEFGVAPISAALTGTFAPLPASLVWMYCAMAAIAILLYHSVREERWRAFVDPVSVFLRSPDALSGRVRRLRAAVLVALPLVLGWRAWAGARATAEPPADPPGIHFSLPGKYDRVRNPYGEQSDWTPAHVREGGVLYTTYCAMCHGDAQDGNGLFARAWQPRPANFRDEGTIAQLEQRYLYWRIKEGGPGLPHGSIGYRSAMPVWGGVLTDDQIWKIIMFEYTAAGKAPRVME